MFSALCPQIHPGTSRLGHSACGIPPRPAPSGGLCPAAVIVSGLKPRGLQLSDWATGNPRHERAVKLEPSGAQGRVGEGSIGHIFNRC